MSEVEPYRFQYDSPELITPIEDFRESYEKLTSQLEACDEAVFGGIPGVKIFKYDSGKYFDHVVPAKFLEAITADLSRDDVVEGEMPFLYIKAIETRVYPGREEGYISEDKELVIGLLPVEDSQDEVHVKAGYTDTMKTQSKLSGDTTVQQKSTERIVLVRKPEELPQRLRWAGDYVGKILLGQETICT